MGLLVDEDNDNSLGPASMSILTPAARFGRCATHSLPPILPFHSPVTVALRNWLENVYSSSCGITCRSRADVTLGLRMVLVVSSCRGEKGVALHSNHYNKSGAFYVVVLKKRAVG